MQINQAGLEIIKTFEGFRARQYVCPAGYPTIGYGHVVKAGEDFTQGVSEEQAEILLKSDLAIAKQAVVRNIKVKLTENQFSSLISFVYNVGGGALQRSTLRQKLNRGEYEAVPGELLKWIYAGGRKLPGLVKRRLAEAELFSAIANTNFHS